MDEELRGTEEQTYYESVIEAEEMPTLEQHSEEESLSVISTEEIVSVFPEEETAPAMPENIVPPVEENVQTGRQEVWRHEPNSPYSPLYVPDRNQVNKNKLTIGMIVVLIITLIVCIVLVLAKVIETAMEEASTGIASWKEVYNEFVEGLEEEPEEADEDSNNWDDWGMIPEPDEDAWPDDFNWEDFQEYNEYDEYDYNDDYFEYEEYIPSPDDEYYVEIVDSIRDDLSYSVDKEEYTYYDENTAVSIYVEYAVVDGEKSAFLDEINTELEESAMFYAREFASEEITDFTLYVESHVTYMDEDILSVVIDEQCYWGYEGTVDLYCLNFDMKTGVLLNNTDILEATEELAEEFRDMSDYQNGYIEHLDDLSDKEIAQYLADEDYLILFYTPVGLEVGLNYYDGWVTATIKNYEKYMRRL